MKQVFTHKDGLGQLLLIRNEENFRQEYYSQKEDFSFHTIAWNTGAAQKVIIDEVTYELGEFCLLPIMLNQSFEFQHPENIVAWQFNREFYCILNHDAEVGCIGFIFFGPSPTMFISLDEEDKQNIQRLLDLFHEEIESEEEIKGEMLRMLLVRLIIIITRLAKKQYLKTEKIAEEKFNLIRQFNLLVEIHFRKEHQVQFYAGLLNKSPKTISNIFSMHFNKTPLQIIQDRIITEANRLLTYTDKSIKEITDDLGFDTTAHFSKFYKNRTAKNPSSLKKNIREYI